MNATISRMGDGEADWGMSEGRAARWILAWILCWLLLLGAAGSAFAQGGGFGGKSGSGLPAQTGNSGKFLTTDGSTASWGTPAGSGTVTHTAGALTLNGILLGAGSADTKAVAGLSSDGTSVLVLGVAGTSAGGLQFKNATSGTLSVNPPTGALGTYSVVWPNAASTLPIFGQQITFAGPTAARTITIPDANWTAARTDAANSFTGTQTFTAIGGTPTITLTNASGFPFATGGTGIVGTGNGGTGVNNGSNNTVTFTGNFPLGITLSGSTTLTFPSTGTLITLAGNEALTNKSINGLTISSSTGTLTIGNGVVLTGPAASGTVAVLGNAQAFSAAETFSAAGAASAPAIKVSGVPFAGTGTTSFPLVYINDANATASTTLSTAGTYFGVNGDGTQDLMNLLKDGTSMFKVASDGTTTVATVNATTMNVTALAPTTNDGAALGDSTHNFSDLFLASGAVINFNAGNYTITHTAGVLTANGALSLGTSNPFTAGTIELGAASDTTIARSSAGVISVEGVVIPSISSTSTLTNKIVDFGSSLASDDTFVGEVISGLNNSGGVTQWDVVYLNSSSQWVKADANGSGTYPAVGIATATASTGNATTVLVRGVFRDDGGTAWTVGSNTYLSTTAGAMTSTPPATTGDKVQVIGTALAAHTVFVHVGSDYGTAP